MSRVDTGKKIGIVAPSFHPMVGGVELYVKGIGAELVKLGHEVHVYTPNKVMGKSLDGAEELVDGIHVHRLPVRFELSYRVKLWSGLRAALERDAPDVIHVYSHDYYSRAAAEAAANLGRPLVITTYGPFETHSDYGALQRMLFRAYDRFVTPSLLRKCARVFVRYPEIASWVESLGVSASKTEVEPSGIPSAYLQGADKARGRELLGHDGELLLYTGRISPQKGVQYAVEALPHVVRRFPKAKLVLVGPDYIDYSRRLTKLAARLGVEESLSILGAVGHRTEAELLAACDVFVMPSSFEGFSQSVMKAMAQGRPVVVSNVGGLPYEIDYGKCGRLYAFGDSRGLATNIVELLESGVEADDLGSNGRLRAKQFTFDRLAQRLSGVYQAA
ncbi:MAG TPA: glycosyltransferase family 4 protein [Nitrososphaerales archaeon]|nr:glycosyltransferase family 4 protein [Nitrososphaerales archaeon]